MKIREVLFDFLRLLLFVVALLIGLKLATLSPHTEEKTLGSTVSGNSILIKGYATSYTAKSTAKTCTGETVREGICGGYKPYIGKTIILYKRLPDDKVGDQIGVYECLDTGIGTKSFQEGKVIDVFKPSLEECQKFMDLVYEDGCKGHVWIQVVEDSKG